MTCCTKYVQLKRENKAFKTLSLILDKLFNLYDLALSLCLSGNKVRKIKNFIFDDTRQTGMNRYA